MPAAELIGLIQNVAMQYGIDPAVAVAQLDLESGHFSDRFVYGPGRSPKGAMGIAQFMPGTWATYGSGNPFDPVAALDAWGRYMSHLLSIFGGRYDLALAGYNWGQNRTALRQALSTGQSVLAYSIPSETRNYVQTILNAVPMSSPGSSAEVGDWDGTNFFGIDASTLESIPSDYLSTTSALRDNVPGTDSLNSMVKFGVIALVGFLFLQWVTD